MATKAKIMPLKAEPFFPDEEPEAKSPIIALVPETRQQALTIPAKALAIEVKDQDSLTLANELLQDIKRIGAQISATFDPQIDQAHKLHKSLLAEKKKFMAPLEQAEWIIKPRIADYLTEQERIRREAEQKRCDAEDKAKAEAEKGLDKAKELEAKGETEKANSLIEKTYEKVDALIDAAPAVPETPKTNGLSLREDWKFMIVDEAQIPREYLVPDLVKIGRIVRALKGDVKIAGVRIYSEKTVSTRIES